MSQIATNVDQLSEEEFDKEFEKLISTPPEQVDQMLSSDSEETQLNESPTEDNSETTNNEENTLEQPVSDTSDEPQEELAAESEPPVGSEDESQAEDSEPTEQNKTENQINWDAIPKDEVLPWEIKANGMTVKATLAELEEGFKRGMNYTQKMQELAPHRKNMYLMQENNLSTEDLALLAEAKKGNKNAIAKLLNDVKVDPLDIEPNDAEKYTQPDIDVDISKKEFEQVSQNILADEQNAPIVENALQTMPNDMYEMVYGDPTKMTALYEDVKKGVYQQVMPEVIKQQTLYGIKEPTVATYLRVAEQMFGQKQESPASVGSQPQQREPEPQRQANNEQLNARKRSAATAPRGKKSTPKLKYTQADLDSMDDEEFDKAFQSVIGRSIDEYK